MRSLAAHLAPLFLLASLAHAQTAPDPKYPAESYVIERSEARYVMAADGTGYRERTLAFRVQSEAALREISVLTIPFASASEKIDILYARVRRPDGTVIETSPADAMEQPEPVTREAPFYSDLKQKQLPIKSLRVGDTLEWKARITRTKPEAPNQFWGSETFLQDVISLNESYELRVPRSVAVNVWTNPKSPVEPAESDEGADHIYRWQTTNLTPTAGPEAEAAKAAKKKKLLTPEEEFEGREGTLPSIAWSTFKSWAAVGAWYASLEKGRVVPDDQIKAKVAELTAGKSTDEDKVRAVYAFVAPQIRYIGVAFGIGRFQPHLASEVLDNQYGDCKDKHTLLAAMLTALGLHPDAILIGEGIRFNEAVPSPAAFNHVITRVTVAGAPIWLDATAEVAPYRVLAYDLRDKSALLIPESGEAHVERTPADLPFPAYQNMKVVGAVDKSGIAESRVTFTLRGDVELVYRSVLRQVPPAQYGEFVQRVSQNIGYAGTTSHPDISRPEDTLEPLTISYDYHRDHSDDWSNNRILPQLEPIALPWIDEKEPPTASIDLGGPFSESSSAELKLPLNWTAQLPEAIHEKAPYATFDETFRFDKGIVYAERKLVVLTRYLPAAQWKSYKKWTDSIHLGDEEFISLVRATGDKSSSADTPAALHPTVSNAEAARLVTRAFEAIDRRDFTTASPLLDQAKDLNNTQKNLWGACGALSWLRADMFEAIRDYQKEIALHPDSTWAYAPLAQCQLIVNRRDDALASLRGWVSVSPENPAATVALVNALLEASDPSAAVEAASKGIAALPPDSRTDPTIQLALGKAQMASGAEIKGAATLTALIKDSDDPLTLNDAAYELAKAFKELPLAESTERNVLDKLGAESHTWTLDENPQTLRQKSSLLVASWDTLGWILFHEGKYQDAEPYVAAAFRNQATPEVGEHLGDIQVQLGNHAEAMKSYELTLAAIPTFNNLGVRTPPGPQSLRLKDKIATEKKAAGKTEKLDPQNALIHLRTLSLGPSTSQGEAEYILLVSSTSIEKAQPTGDKSVPGGASLILKANPATLIPPGSDAKLAKLAILNCHSSTCDLIFEP